MSRSVIDKGFNQLHREIDRLALEVRAYQRRDLPELVGSQEAAAILGVNPVTIGTRLHRGKMPAPLAQLACGPIWDKADIEAMNGKKR